MSTVIHSNNEINRMMNARAYLADTDWYVTRKMETGIKMPSEILAKREEARKSIV